ncbi:MAG: Na/Pi symporter [Planctomycetota bacterium]
MPTVEAPLEGGWLSALGGLGLFLFGMGVMTDGLRSLAGPSLARWLARSTRSVVGGTLTGAVTTAVIQSSSATTVTAIGFVNAGLLTFQQSLGIVYGANIGTSVTGWMVAVFGFQVDLGSIAPLMVLAGALLRLKGKGHAAALGSALAGFGLLFTGIDALQAGMAGLEGHLAPADLPRDTWLGRGALVGVGALLTLVMQSSSAALATALAALHTGAITLPQATALVIGMNVGTTSTALLAALGGTTAARRTGYAHLAFNLGTGAAAFMLLPALPRAFALVEAVLGRALNPELSVALFHTTFNLGGALLFVPLTPWFAAHMSRLVPERVSGPARRLDRALLDQPDIALEAVAATTRELARAALRQVALDLRSPTRAAARADNAQALKRDTAQARAFLGDIRLQPKDTTRRAAIVELFDALDHIARMLVRTAPKPAPAHGANATSRRLAREHQGRATRLAGALVRAASALRDGGQGADLNALEAAWRAVDEDAQGLREEVLRLAADDALEPDEALTQMDEVRRVTRVGRHAYRLALHLERAGKSVSAATPRAVPLGGTGASAPEGERVGSALP